MATLIHEGSQLFDNCLTLQI